MKGRRAVRWLRVGVGAAVMLGACRWVGADGALDDLAASLTRSAQRLERAIAAEPSDPDWAVVRAYEARVRARDLVRILANPVKSLDLRRAAFDALTSNTARNLDPDLAVERDHGSPRNEFCLQHVVPLLDDGDVTVRELAHALLMALVPPRNPVPAITGYDARSGTPQSFHTAQKAWTRILRR